MGLDDMKFSMTQLTLPQNTKSRPVGSVGRAGVGGFKPRPGQHPGSLGESVSLVMTSANGQTFCSLLG